MKGRCLILSTLDIKKEQIRFYIYTIFCILFTIIYQQFSHGVISYYMILSFLFPLIGLLETQFIINKNKNIKIISHNLFKSSIITFTLGSILKGVLDIYGTTNKLIITYLILGLILLIISIIAIKFQKTRK